MRMPPNGSLRIGALTREYAPRFERFAHCPVDSVQLSRKVCPKVLASSRFERCYGC